jgi:hypothetical protein
VALVSQNIPNFDNFLNISTVFGTWRRSIIVVCSVDVALK